jgi:hypothetical protein
MFVFKLLWLWIDNKDGKCYMWSCFFGHSQATRPGFPQYKQKLFVRWSYLSYFMKGFNLDLSICMGLSFGEVVEG